jgi:hypothetical protein
MEDWFGNGASSDLRKEGAALATIIPLRFRIVSTPLALFCVDGSTILSQANQSYSQMVDLADVDNSLSILPPGQSEFPTSPYRFSTLKLWQKAKLHPAPLSREAVTKIQATQKILPLPKTWKRKGD